MKQFKISEITKHVILSIPMKENSNSIEYCFNSKMPPVVNEFMQSNKVILNYEFIDGMTDFFLERWFLSNTTDKEIQKILKPLQLELSKEKYRYILSY